MKHTKVKRFDTKYRPFSKGMEEDKLGCYVQYYDYEQLEKRNAEMYEALKEIVIKHQKNGLGNWKWVTKLESLLKEIES